MLTNRATKSQ